MRKYDSDFGRFTSIDPDWELYRDLTPYNYCENNPLLLKDPSGFGPGDMSPNKKMLPAGYDGGGGGAGDIGKEGSEYKPSTPNQAKAGGESGAKPRTSTIKANKVQGEAAEAKVNAKIDATKPDANQTQVTVKSTESGTKMRADNLVKNGKQNTLNETKSTAKVIETPQEAMKLLSSNQRAVMTEAANGVQVQVRGSNGGDYYPNGGTITVQNVRITVSDPQGLKVFQVTPSTTK